VGVRGRPVRVHEVKGVWHIARRDTDEAMRRLLEGGDVARLLQLAEAQIERLERRYSLKAALLPQLRVLVVVIPVLPVGVAGHDVAEEEQTPIALHARRARLPALTLGTGSRHQLEGSGWGEGLEQPDHSNGV
jgi:hypothetical protein